MGYKRTKILINPKFQIRFSLLICFVLLVLSSLYPVMLYLGLDSIISQIATNVPQAKAAALVEQKNSLIVWLILVQIGFIGLVFLIIVFFSHKIAGPLYKLSKFFAAIRDGRNPGRLFFRKGDYFLELADEFNDAFESIQENYKNDFVYISEVNAYLKNLSLVVPDDKKVVLGEINKRLSEIQERFNDY